MSTSSYRLLAGSAVALLVACGGSSGLPSVTPNIGIDSPNNNGTINLPADKHVAINFSTNYTLKAPGSCQGLDYCGHVYLLIDSTSCNLPNMQYNALAVSSPAQADLSKCPTPTGTHSITLELHNDDESTVRNLVGSPVTASVTILAQ